MAYTHLYNHTMVFAEARIHCVNLLFIICLINIILMVFIALDFFSYSWSGVGGGVLILHTGIWRCGSPNYIGGPGFLVKCSWWLRLEQIISGHMRHAEE